MSTSRYQGKLFLLTLLWLTLWNSYALYSEVNSTRQSQAVNAPSHREAKKNHGFVYWLLALAEELVQMR